MEKFYFLPTDEADVLDANLFAEQRVPVFLDGIRCSGSEGYIFDCEHTTVHMCSHDDDVAVICHRKHALCE